MKNTYHAYMLRLWKVGEGAGAIWRASLEDPHSGAHRTFADLDLLVSFLQEMVGAQGSAATTPSALDAPQALEKR